MNKASGCRWNKKGVLCIVVIGVAMLMFGCGKKSNVNPLGDHLTWTYNKLNKTLTISGQGEMPDDSWEKFKELSIKTLVMEEGVTSIAPSAFYYHPEMKGKLIIPNTVKSIGDFAFYECSGLTGDLVIPEGVTQISDYAFRGCAGLDGRLILGSELGNIGEYAFAGCGFSGKISIPEQVVTVNSHVFDGCNRLEEVEFQEGLEVISCQAFYDCKSLKKVEFPTGIKIIGDMAFSYTDLSGHIEFPEGLYSIGDSCFRSCNHITGITLPETLFNIKDYAFANCEELGGELFVPDNVAYVGKNAFSNCRKLSSVTFGSGISSIGPGAFAGCSGMRSAYLSDFTPDYYSMNEAEPSFDAITELVGFDESKKGSVLWNDYKESKLSEGSKTTAADGDTEEKSEPYYWTNSLERETFKGTGSFADTTLYFMDEMIHVSINGRDYLQVPYEADPNEEERRIKVDHFVYLYGVLSDLEFFDNGYMQGVIRATLSWDDGTEEKVLFAVGSEETVLPFGYEGGAADSFPENSYEDEYAQEFEDEFEYVREVDVEDNPELELWGEPYNDFYFIKYEDDRHEDGEGNPILWFGDPDMLVSGCSVYCAVENEEIKATASSTLKDNGSISYGAENICVQNNAQAWVEGSDGSGIGEYIEIKRTLDVSDKAYGVDYTEICIVNGYMKNEKVWKNNNRVKTLAFYYNDKYIFDIELEDICSPQIISLEDYNIHADSGEEVVFKYVIKEVYKGDKYDDTAITGIIMDFYTPNH